jgi:glutaredoxin
MKLTVFSATYCPHCPPAKELVKQLAEKYSFNYEIIDLDQCSDPEKLKLAEELNIMAVPTIIYNDSEIAFVGVPRPEELEEYIKQRLDNE